MLVYQRVIKNYICTQGEVKIEDIAKFFLGVEGRLGKLMEIG